AGRQFGGPILRDDRNVGDRRRYELGRAGRYPVRLEDERDEISISFFAQRSAVTVGHVLLHERKQVADCLLCVTVPSLFSLPRPVALGVQRVTPRTRRTEHLVGARCL